MGLGLGTLAVVLGLVVLAGVVDLDSRPVDDTTLGWVLLAVGSLVVVLAAVTSHRRSRTHRVGERRAGGRR